MNFNYYKATVADVETLVEKRILFSLELAGEQSEEAIQFLRKQMTNYFSKSIIDNSSISIIAKDNEAVAGIGSIHLREMPGNFKNPSGRWGYIMNMYTIREYRRKGVCKNILRILLEEGKKIGLTAFELHATKEGEMVYTQEGFVRHNEPTLRYLLNQN
jgi:predicted acetyltransferase